MWTSVASLSRLNYRLRSSSQLAPRDGFWMGKRLRPAQEVSLSAPPQPTENAILPAAAPPRNDHPAIGRFACLPRTGPEHRWMRTENLEYPRTKTYNSEVIHARAQA